MRFQGGGNCADAGGAAYDRLNDVRSTLADAILDRLVHNAHRIQLRGDSLRRKRMAATAPDA
jgi:hypothetical protein